MTIEEKRQIFTQYIEEHQQAFYRLVYSYTKNSDASLDVIQDAIIKGFSKLIFLRNFDYVRTWFYRILVNESLNYLKHQKRWNCCSELDPDLFTYQEPDHDMQLFMQQAIFDLDFKYRQMIILYFFEEFTFEEISQILKLPTSTVKSRFYKALSLLKEEIGDDRYEKC